MIQNLILLFKYRSKDSNYDMMFTKGHIMVKIHLSRLLGERRMTQKRLSELTGIRRNAINEWYNEITVSLKVEHIDRICE